jgi:hypothetical protein
VIINGQPTSGQSKMGDLASLLKWHYESPVTDRDRRRNQTVYDAALNPTYYQNNRNPYVDHPEWIWAIWGTQPNNSQLSVAAPGADGTSSVSVVFGPVIVGAPAPGTSAVTLNKAGSTPTTFDIGVSGAATCSPSGPRQAFAYDAQSRVLTVGVSTGGVGAYGGTVTIHNTDLTSAGGGMGLNDGDDTIVVSAVVLDHASPSLAPAPTLTQTIDFGTVARNSGVQSRACGVFDLAAAPALAAGLDIDSVSAAGTPAGATGVITTTLAPTANIAPGSSLSAIVSLDSSAPAGDYSVVYTIVTSDQDLPGAIAEPTLTLTVVGLIKEACPGDLNGDGYVEDADFVIFARAYDLFDCADPAMASGCPADLNGDGWVDDADFVLFAAAYDQFVCP